ncbi:c-type cytochrome biogenesis protein CcmI [Magnetospira sp. QH-2]|uniref:c-type cytochrome biogenesis protein CcmI n=1 Tax=Magnetospira sp. (strain QH-2) TaxID=1288970 RepID=UPI0003E8180F|nr:c-type cytochrome biogenesis protein CcmI [Magnetospira sp. QH-2]CCQ75364.1 putative Cytochrome c-type biogenesis protein CycH [Magnetospira sp. QH-2]
MTGVWIAAAVMTAASLGMLLWPLIRKRAETNAQRADYDLNVFKDQLAEVDRDEDRGLLSADQATAVRTEIQRRILDVADRAKTDIDSGAQKTGGVGPVAIVIGGFMPLVAVLLYFDMGSPTLRGFPAAERQGQTQSAAADQARMGHREQGQAGDMATMLARLAERLKANPEDPGGWTLLGRSYLSEDRYQEAANAYREAHNRLEGPAKDEVGIDLAEALTMVNDGQISMQASMLFKKGLAARPYHPKPRFYLANMRAQMGDVKGALQDFVDMKALGPPDAGWIPIVEKMIAETAADVDVDPSVVTPTPEILQLAKARESEQQAAAPTPTPTPAPAPTASAPRGPTREQMQQAADMTPEERMDMIRSMIAGLAQRLEENPDDLGGWTRLARAYRVLGETAKAEEAEAKIKALQGN